jgi:RES domain-containing protein
MSRRVRKAPDAAIFDARTIRVTLAASLQSGPWFRLAQTAYLDPFYPNPGSRFTPKSLAFPCIYLAVDKATTVSEVYGDRMALAQEAGDKFYTITKAEASAYAYATIAKLPDPLAICDLTDSETLLNTGLDITSYHDDDLATPQEWAERIVHHPAKFDGIQYRSRHTDKHCLVIWNRPGSKRDFRTAMAFDADGPFLHSKEAFVSATMRGLKLSFV